DAADFSWRKTAGFRPSRSRRGFRAHRRLGEFLPLRPGLGVLAPGLAGGPGLAGNPEIRAIGDADDPVFRRTASTDGLEAGRPGTGRSGIGFRSWVGGRLDRRGHFPLYRTRHD